MHASRYSTLLKRKDIHKIEQRIDVTEDIKELRELAKRVLKDMWKLRKEYYRLFEMIDEYDTY